MRRQCLGNEWQERFPSWVLATTRLGASGCVPPPPPPPRGGWADRLFSEQGHDFGAVPRGAKVRHAFLVSNRFDEPVTILDVRASCGCTTGHASTQIVPPGGSATIDAEMDTRNFVGKKATTLYVTLVSATGRQAEVRLGVSATILSDIVLNPGTVDFGAVTRGQTPSQTLTIDRVGLSSWQVQRMVSSCRAVDATLSETARNGQNVSYLLKVSLRADAPIGTFRDELQLITNDPETPIVPVSVTATVRGDLTASPALLSLGTISATSKTQGRFIVRASKPFVIEAIEGDGDGFKAEADNALPQAVHLVSVSYRGDEGATRGDLRHVFRVRTNLAGEPLLELVTTLHVNP